MSFSKTLTTFSWTMNEKQFSQLVQRKLSRFFKVESFESAAPEGFPDLMIVREGKIVLVELKVCRHSDEELLRPAQSFKMLEYIVNRIPVFALTYYVQWNQIKLVRMDEKLAYDFNSIHFEIGSALTLKFEHQGAQIWLWLRDTFLRALED